MRGSNVNVVVLFLLFLDVVVHSLPDLGATNIRPSTLASDATTPQRTALPKKRKKKKKTTTIRETLESSTASAKRKSNPRKPTMTTRSSSHKKLNKTFLLRIQREWKNIVKEGMAFDWSKGQPIQVPPASPQHVWIGPGAGGSWRSWWFSFTGPTESPFDGGLYHGRITLPPDYPARPPTVQVLTCSGRFQPGAKICLSASSYHPESWQPASWGVLTLVQSLRLHMISAPTEVGSCTGTYQEKLDYATKSRMYKANAVVDHEHMIRQGWIAEHEWNQDDDEMLAKSIEEASENGVMKLVASLFKGPQSRWIVVFLVVFFLLNR